MSISKKRREYILCLAQDTLPGIDESVYDDNSKLSALNQKVAREIKKFLSSTISPEELDLFARAWNWDGNVAPLLQLIQNPWCSAGTALCLFWYGCPEDYYLFYRTLQECESWERNDFRLLLQIEKRYTKGQFATSEITFDPRPRINMEDRKSEFARQIPEMMYEPSSGSKQTKPQSGKRCFEFKDTASKKFWNIELKGASHNVQFGRIGTDGRKQTKKFGSRSEARESYERLINQKVGKGYKEIKGKSGTKTSSNVRTKPKKKTAVKKSPAKLKAEGRVTSKRVQPKPSKKRTKHKAAKKTKRKK